MVNMVLRGITRLQPHIQDPNFSILKDGPVAGFFVYKYLGLHRTQMQKENRNQ